MALCSPFGAFDYFRDHLHGWSVHAWGEGSGDNGLESACTEQQLSMVLLLITEIWPCGIYSIVPRLPGIWTKDLTQFLSLLAEKLKVTYGGMIAIV